MSLNFSAERVENFEEKVADDEGKSIYNALIWLTMFVDYGRTDADPDEFVWRVRFYEQVHGPYLQRATEQGWEPRPLTVDEIKQFVGLHTNVTNTTRLAFIKKMAKQFEV